MDGDSPDSARGEGHDKGLARNTGDIWEQVGISQFIDQPINQPTMQHQGTS